MYCICRSARTVSLVDFLYYRIVVLMWCYEKCLMSQVRMVKNMQGITKVGWKMPFFFLCFFLGGKEVVLGRAWSVLLA